MNVSKVGSILSLIGAIIIIVMACFGLLIGLILGDLIPDPGVDAVINSALPFFYIYLTLGIIGLVIAIISFKEGYNKIFAGLNIGINATILIYTTIITVLNMPLIIETGVDIPIIAFASTFTIFLIASILGTIGGVLRLKS
ncbi:MAG: hypothetical protein EAX96_12815 [Candidatus Lokiarchaeota archaeon]|nr:hypothetical protein [Candidatus Lokiarchaeota archaeon]